MAHGEGFLALVNKLRKNIKEFTVDEIYQRMQKGDKFHFVDVREDNEWNKDHLKNAIHIGKGVIERDIETKIPDRNAEIVLYCGGGFRSVIAADTLQQMGYKNVSSMDGGYREWSSKGFPLEKS